MRSGAIHDYARGEIAVVEIGIRLAEFRDHLVDLVSEDAARTRDQLRQRRRLHFTCSLRFAWRSFDSRIRANERTGWAPTQN